MNMINISLKKVAMVFAISAASLLSYAGIEPELKNFLTGGAIVAGANVSVSDLVFLDANGNQPVTPPPAVPDPSNPASWYLQSCENEVTLEINQQTINDCVFANFSLTLTVAITRHDEFGNSLGTVNKNLTINYDNTQGNKYKEKHTFTYSGGYYTNVQVTTVGNPAVVNYVKLYTSTVIERYRDIDLTTATTFNPGTFNSADNTITVNWQPVDEAEEYDLEWTWIDDVHSTSGVILPSALEYNFKNNASRVTLTDNSYTITGAYEQGYLLCRVRPVGKGGTDFTQRIPGKWSSDDYCSTIDCAVGLEFTSLQDMFYLQDGHATPPPPSGTPLELEYQLTWQYSAVYAEGGKKKEVISYFDGSLRSRQSVTRLNTDLMSVVGEQVFDHQGRPAINILPVPAHDNAISYHPDFNIAELQNRPYDRTDFDYGAACDTRSIREMDDNSGASLYYSENNPEVGNMHYEYIATAEKFPFSVTEYMPDNTGRIRRQGGVGNTHQLETNHETKYYYGVPDQVELDRLFGNAVGYKDHYEKNMVIDPNGQVSVSYLDASGRTVATALAGESPQNVTALDYSGNTNGVTENLISESDEQTDPDMTFISKKFNVPVQGNYTFDYSVQVPRHTDAQQPTLCFDCVYDLVISLTDECGDQVFDGDPIASGNQPIIRTLGKPGSDFDTDCESGSLDYSFSGDADLNSQPITVNLSIGTYTLTKTLKINEQAIDYYADKFVDGNTSLQTEQDFIDSYLADIDYSRCGMTCESCKDDIGTKSEFSTAEQAKLTAQGVTITQDHLDRIDDHYDELLAYCNRLCIDWDDECEVYYKSLISDVSPGGQYATFDLKAPGEGDDEFDELLDVTSTSHDLKFNYQYKWITSPTTALDWIHNSVQIDLEIRDENTGEIKTVTPAELTPQQFIDKFQPSWAEYLVQFHPEYCRYEFCVDEDASNQYDRDMLATETYADALTAGYLNPTNRSSLSATYPLGTKDPFWTGRATEESNINTLMDAYKNPRPGMSGCNLVSMWDVALSTYICTEEVTCTEINSCISSNSWASVSCKPYQDQMWQMFRAMYLAEKHRIKKGLSDWTCARTASMTGHDKRFYDVDDAEGLFTDVSKKDDTYDEAVDGIEGHCDDICEGQAENWMLKLEGCNMSDADEAAMKADLIKICQNSCDSDNPMGASNIPGGKTKRVATPYNSFEEVFDAYAAAGKLTKVDAICDINLISSPKPYGHNYSDRLETSACESVRDAGNNGCILDEENDELREAMVQAYENDSSCQKCINCDQLWEAINHVQSKYTSDFIDDNFAKQEITTKLINEYLSFNLSYTDYYNFAIECLGEPDTFVHDSMLWYYYENFEYATSPVSSVEMPDYGPQQYQQLYRQLNNKDLWPEFTPREREWASTMTSLATLSVPDTVQLKSCHCDQLESQMQTWLLNQNPVPTEPLQQSDIDQFNEDISCWEIPGDGPAFDFYSILSKCRDAYAMDGGKLGLVNVWTQKKKMALAYLVTVDTLEMPDCFPCGLNDPQNGFYRDTARAIVPCDSFITFMDSFLQANNEQQLVVELTKYLYDRDETTLSSNIGTLEAMMDDFYIDFPHAFKDTADSTLVYEVKQFLLDYLPCLILKDVPTDTCCMDVSLEGRRLLDVLNGLTDSYGPLGNHLVYDNWLAYPHLDDYYDSPLYDSTQCKDSLYYIIDEYDMPTLSFELADTCGDTTNVKLSYLYNLNNSAYFGNITRFFNFRPVSDITCDDDVHYFNVDVDQIMGDGRSFTTTLVGYAPDWVLYDTCEVDTILLCDRGIEDFIEIQVEDPCSTRLEALAKYQAGKAYENYILQVKHDFREAYKLKCREAFPSEVFTKSWDIQEYHYTLYYYDQANNLIQTVPPAGVQVYTSQVDLDAIDDYRKTQAGSPLYPGHTLLTQYEFNTLNQLVEQTTPDGGTSQFYYDAVGRMVISQNAQQATSFDYSYTLYDDLGRITEVGELNNMNIMNWTVAFDPVQLDNFITTANSHKEVTQTHYDEDQIGISYNNFTMDNLRNRVASMTYWDDLTDPNFKHGVHYSYDIHGNVKSLLRDIVDLGAYYMPPINHQYKQINYEYDLISSNVNKVIYEPGEEDQFIHKYDYDADNRITKVYTSTNDIHYDKEAEYFYFKHGSLMRTELGELKVQGVDYAYTIHGWLKGVNSNTLKDSRDIGKDGQVGSTNHLVARDVFGFSLGYYDGDYQAIGEINGTIVQTNHFLLQESGGAYTTSTSDLYNGNIKHMVTAIQPFLYALGEPQGMAYEYDQLNRIKSASAWNNADITNNIWIGTGNALPDYHTEYSYDPNGNIIDLLRQGYSGTNINMDQFQYNYNPGTNQLDHVTDNPAWNANYAEDIDNQSAGNYTYDAIGNMIQDMAEQIQTIEWTVYGKIESITRTPGSTKDDLEFEYTPDGHRVLKRAHHKDPGGNIISYTETYYIRDASGNIMATYERTDEEFKWESSPIYGSSRVGVYEADKLLVQNGVAVGSSLASNEYEHHRGKRRYELSNHLGNVLAVVSDKRTHTCIVGTTFDHYAAEIISANDYYPFGMIMPNRTYQNSAYRFGFNGKEQDLEVGLGNQYDYGFRIYNPGLARFLSVDPLFRSYPFYSPYQFAANTPICAIDMDGLEMVITITAGYWIAEIELLMASEDVNVEAVVATAYAATQKTLEDLPSDKARKWAQGGGGWVDGKAASINFNESEGITIKYTLSDGSVVQHTFTQTPVKSEVVEDVEEESSTWLDDILDFLTDSSPRKNGKKSSIITHGIMWTTSKKSGAGAEGLTTERKGYGQSSNLDNLLSMVKGGKSMSSGIKKSIETLSRISKVAAGDKKVIEALEMAVGEEAIWGESGGNNEEPVGDTTVRITTGATVIEGRFGHSKTLKYHKKDTTVSKNTDIGKMQRDATNKAKKDAGWNH